MALRLTELVKRFHQGTQILREWLGNDAVPVEQEKAEARASVCVHCPKNYKARWWESAVGAIADAIRRQIEVKNKISMKVSVENEIGMCRCCGCALPLKVFVPIGHIRNHITAEHRACFQNINHPRGLQCWIENEL